MKKETNSKWQARFLFAVLVVVGFQLTAHDVAAQTQVQFNQLYECPRWPHNFKVLSDPNEKNYQVSFVNLYTPSSSFQDEVRKEHILNAIQLGGCKLNGKPLESVKNSASQEAGAGNNQLRPPGNNKPQAGRFKVGERVLASPASMIADEWFEKCTVIKDMMVAEGADAYRVLCDNADGGIGRESYVKVPYIKAWANATPPPATPECPLNEPAGTVSKTSKPSAELFKRVLFERYRDTSNGRKIGITYETFELGRSFVNRLTGGGLLHDGAPQGATIYPVKTKFLYCDRHTDSTVRTIYEAQYNCFKDSFGAWVCPNSALKLSKPIYLPNK
ncbi:MAG TPA: hypothetical protein VNA17_01545 [Pyrinomonadaceae bacterium]|nr:hypothetical protein [Pyrinomonadaceae bacterium]